METGHLPTAIRWTTTFIRGAVALPNFATLPGNRRRSLVPTPDISEILVENPILQQVHLAEAPPEVVEVKETRWCQVGGLVLMMVTRVRGEG